MCLVFLRSHGLLLAAMLPLTAQPFVPDSANSSSSTPLTPDHTVAVTYSAPTSHERFHQYLHDTFGPMAFLGIAASAGLDQLRQDPPEWQLGAAGFGERFGQVLISETTRYGIASAMHQDTRYYRCSCTGFFPRFRHAVVSSFTARKADGRTVFSVANVLAPYAGSLVATSAWYPDRYSPKDGFQRGSTGLSVNIGLNVVREFLPWYPR
jgi:hypothetical protein